jgi:hypothetical protein
MVGRFDEGSLDDVDDDSSGVGRLEEGPLLAELVGRLGMVVVDGEGRWRLGLELVTLFVSVIFFPGATTWEILATPQRVMVPV